MADDTPTSDTTVKAGGAPDRSGAAGVGELCPVAKTYRDGVLVSVQLPPLKDPTDMTETEN